MDPHNPLNVTGPVFGPHPQESDAVFALDQMILLVPPLNQFRVSMGRERGAESIAVDSPKETTLPFSKNQA